jgi:uncharacterized membrane protein
MGKQQPELKASIKETERVEAFSDGVFAIAITLRVLDLKVPRGLQGAELILGMLREQWPAYLSFLISFGTIGIMWINHHYLFNLIVRTVSNASVMTGSRSPCPCTADGGW